METQTINPETLKVMPWPQLVQVIGNDFKPMYFGAVPYFQAMQQMATEKSNYYEDSGKSIILYFLSNAATWKGEVARAVKKELQRRTK